VSHGYTPMPTKLIGLQSKRLQRRLLSQVYLQNFHLDMRTAVSADIRTENDRPAGIRIV